MVEQSASLARKVAIGSAFMVALRLSTRLIGVASMLILVNLLMPEDFGLVSMAYVSISVLQTLTNMALSLPIIQLDEPQRRHYDSAWTLSIIRGLTLSVILVTCASTVAWLMKEPRVETLIYALAVVTMIQGFNNIGFARYQREMRFDKLLYFQIVGKIVAFCTQIPLALIFQNYWALIAGLIAGQVATMIWSYIYHPYRPRLSLAAARELLGMTKWMMASNILWVIDSYAPVVLIGRFGGPVQVGLFQVSQTIGGLPASDIAAPIRDPIFAGMVNTQSDLGALRRHFLGSIGVALAVVLPLSMGIFLMADWIAEIALGDGWEGAGTIMQFCALYLFVDALVYQAHNVFVAVHRTKLFARLFAVSVTLRTIAILIGAYYDGASGAAAGLLMTSIVSVLYWYRFMMPLIELPFSDIVSTTWRSVTAGMIMIASVSVLWAVWPLQQGFGPLLLQGLAVMAAGAIVHIGSQLALWWASGMPEGAETAVLSTVRKAVQTGRRAISV